MPAKEQVDMSQLRGLILLIQFSLMIRFFESIQWFFTNQ